MSHGGMSPRGGLSDVSAGAETLREGEPAPFADAYDLAEAPVRVTLAETREQVLRSFLRERGDRGGTAPSSVDALLDSMEAARRGTSVMLVRPHERAPARASDDAFSFGRVIRSGSANVDDPDGDPSSVRGGGSAEADAFGIDSIDTRAAARWLEHTVPIVVIILVSFLLKRAASLATFAWTTAVFLKANDVLKRGVSIGVHTHTERPIDSDVRDEEEGENTLGASRRRSSTSRETSPNDAVNSASNAARTSETEPSLARSQTERHTNLSARTLSDSKDDLRNGSINEKKRFAALLAALALSGGAVGVLAKAFPNESFWDAFFFRAQTNALAEKKTGTGGDAIADSDSVSFLDHLWRAAMALAIVPESAYLPAVTISGNAATATTIATSAHASTAWPAEGAYLPNPHPREDDDEAPSRREGTLPCGAYPPMPSRSRIFSSASAARLIERLVCAAGLRRELDRSACSFSRAARPAADRRLPCRELLGCGPRPSSASRNDSRRPEDGGARYDRCRPRYPMAPCPRAPRCARKLAPSSFYNTTRSFEGNT